MTDHYAVVNPEDLPHIEVAQPPFVCDQCERTFNSQSALGVHKRSHQPKQPCPECGEMYQPGPGLERHRQAAHGAKVGERNGSRPEASKRHTVTCPECGQEMRKDNLRRHMRDKHGALPKVQKQDHDWDVDEIFQAVVGLMWPGGDIPVAAVLSLVKWREDTQRMLTEVRGE